MERKAKHITDLSDKGKRANKRLRYEVGYWVTPNWENEEPHIYAKFQAYGDALLYAQWLSVSPDPSEVLIRS